LRLGGLTREKERKAMLGIEWLKPAVFFGSMIFALMGVFIFWLCFIIIDKLTPYDLWAEIIEKKNVALAIVVGAMCIAIGLIVSAAVHG
jgi:putative membrane protein